MTHISILTEVHAKIFIVKNIQIILEFVINVSKVSNSINLDMSVLILIAFREMEADVLNADLVIIYIQVSIYALKKTLKIVSSNFLE